MQLSLIYYIILCFYRRQYVALKICVADSDPKHELEIFDRVSRTPPVPPNVLQLLDHFSLQGPNGMHTVLVLNVLGSLLSVVRSPNRLGRNHVRKLCRQITIGLAALHHQGIVHGGMCQLERVLPINMAI